MLKVYHTGTELKFQFDGTSEQVVSEISLALTTILINVAKNENFNAVEFVQNFAKKYSETAKALTEHLESRV
jgi:hypothetical protein